jgi:Concanavalin A-like lectin/glucanases superfamily
MVTMRNKLALVAFLAMAITLIAGALQLTVADGPKLAGRWHLNETTGDNTGDSSGNGNNGLVVNAIHVQGRFGNALRFDEGKYVQVVNSTVLEPKTISVEAWVKAVLSDVNVFQHILAKGAHDCTAASYALYTGQTRGLSFYIFNGTDSYLSPDAGTGVWDGNWHHIAGTYDGTVIRLYVDGAQIGSGTPIATSIAYGLSDSADFFIGTYALHLTNPSCVANFVGSIDEVRVWDGVLTDDVVAQHASTNSSAP